VLGPIPITAHQTTIIPLTLGLSDLSLASVILSIFAGTVQQAAVNFKGKVSADGIPIAIPVDLTYQIL
jgi:hypothetical protein